MLGTRIIHVLCPWWKSVFAATVRETVSEGGDAGTASSADEGEREQCSHSDPCMGWHLTGSTDSYGKKAASVPGRSAEDVKIIVKTFLAERGCTLRISKCD